MTARLAYLALSLHNVADVARMLESSLKLPRIDGGFGLGQRDPASIVGETALVLYDVDDPSLGEGSQAGLHHAGFAVSDPEGWITRAGVRSRILDDGAVALEPADTCGLRIRLCRMPQREPVAGSLVERIDHVGVASADNRAAMDLFAGRWGFPLES